MLKLKKGVKRPKSKSKDVYLPMTMPQAAGKKGIIGMHLPANEDGIRNVAEQCSNSVTTEMNSSIYFKIVYYNEERK